MLKFEKKNINDRRSFLCLITKKIKRFFTLLEMVVTLAVFLILIAIVLTFYDTVFKMTEVSSSSSMIFENARIALDIISRDIQCIYYKNEETPFWHKGNYVYLDPDDILKADPDWGEYSYDLLAFVSATPLPQSEVISRLCEVKYQLYFDPDLDLDSAGWILRSVTGDNSDSWNFQDNFDVGLNGANYAFTADNSSSEPFQKLIPNVTGLSFNCFDKEGDQLYVLDPDIDPDIDPDSTQFPYSIQVTLSLMDKNSWQKYKNLFKVDFLAAEAVKYENERTFTKTIFVGEHGQ